MVFAWRPSPAAEAQELNALMGGDNFALAAGGLPNYLSSGVLPASASRHEMRLTPGAVYFWRVNTRTAGIWVAGAERRFETERCLPFDDRNAR